MKKEKCPYIWKRKNILILINNTQLFWDENGECREEYRDEIKIIETNLAEYLYEFPYKRISSNNGVF